MFDWIADPNAWVALATLTALEIVLGVDNIIFISILVGRLPPEKRDLATQLGVSRPSVREALIALEVEGIVEVRMGSGIYVTALEPVPAARPAAQAMSEALGPFDIIRARALVEAELAAVAAREGTPALVKRLRGAIRMMEDDIARGVMPIRGDREFHLALAEASGNAALVRVVTELFDERNNPLFEQLGRHFENSRSWRHAVTEHRAVVRAMVSGRSAMSATTTSAAPARRAAMTHMQPMVPPPVTSTRRPSSAPRRCPDVRPGLHPARRARPARAAPRAARAAPRADPPTAARHRRSRPATPRPRPRR